MNDLQKDGVMSDWNQIGALKVAAELREFIEKEGEHQKPWEAG
jgi:hypothetical protein